MLIRRLPAVEGLGVGSGFQQCELVRRQDGLVNLFGVLAFADELDGGAHGHGNDDLDGSGKSGPRKILLGLRSSTFKRFVLLQRILAGRFTIILAVMHGKSWATKSADKGGHEKAQKGTKNEWQMADGKSEIRWRAVLFVQIVPFRKDFLCSR